MNARIRQIEVSNRSLVPAEAEVWITVVPEQQTATTELRGRLMGPRCRYASTVEVAYPLRPLPPGRTPPGAVGLTARVVIPEASLWEPQSPFLYHGPVELWQDGRRCDQVTLTHGLRSFQLGAGGLRVNGRPLALRGRPVAPSTDDEALTLRQAGYNLLLAPVAADILPLWERADRLGFLMLGQVADESPETLAHLAALHGHACCLGWVLAAGMENLVDRLPPGGLVGLASHAALRPGANFLVGPPASANRGLPLLVTGEGAVAAGRPDGPLILGSVG